MQIFNTLTRKKEEFIPLKEGEFSIYVCGPTVYNFIHIGNARPVVVFDVLHRYLCYLGYKVNFVSNITDIDDKIIASANEKGMSMADYARKFEDEYMRDIKGLFAKEATAYPRATEHIDEILHIIADIIEKGYGYVAKNGDVYFRAKKFKEYGKLSHLILDDLQSGNRKLRSEMQENLKEDEADFAVWKAAKEGEPYWQSPYGNGRPGWHIECSAMARKHLGKTIDLHCGGEDLIFPHHENEIAQSECANGCNFARYWMHNGFLNIDNEKMSKSKNNFFTVRQIAEHFGYEPLRYFLLTGHYRVPLNYTQDLLSACKASLTRLYTCRDNLQFAIDNSKAQKGESDEALNTATNAAKVKFEAALNDDLNTVNALAALFDYVRDINTLQQSAGKNELESALLMFKELCGVLGILQQEKNSEIPPEIELLVQSRAQAKKDRDFAKADAIRDEIKALGYSVEDTKDGAKIAKIQ